MVYSRTGWSTHGWNTDASCTAVGYMTGKFAGPLTDAKSERYAAGSECMSGGRPPGVPELGAGWASWPLKLLPSTTTRPLLAYPEYVGVIGTVWAPPRMAATSCAACLSGFR